MESEAKDKAQRIKDLEARIAAAREQRDAAEARRKAQFAEKDLETELALEDLRARDEETLIELEAQHGREGIVIARIQTQRNGMVVVKKPNHLHYGRFVDKGKSDRVSLEKLVGDHLVYPDRARFDEIIQDEFDTLRKCSNALAALHGLNLREELPKG